MIDSPAREAVEVRGDSNLVNQQDTQADILRALGPIKKKPMSNVRRKVGPADIASLSTDGLPPLF